MKTTSVLAIVSWLLFASSGIADDHHEADEGLEKTLRANLNERHVHVEVHKGIVKLDGHVTTETERERIDSLVRNTPGVVGIKDDLRIGLPSPGTPLTYTPTPAIPIYQAAPPEVAPPATVVTMPPPVVIAEYPRLKLQAWTMEDQDSANRIGHQLQADQVPVAWLQDVTITVRDGNAWVRGLVDSQEQHDMLIGSVQHAGGVRAIYDQLQIRR